MTNNTMANPSSIERVVMRRIYTMRVLQFLFSNTVIAAAIGTVSLWGIGREVWVAKVFANGPQDLLGHLTYFGYAFEHTRILVQALALGVLAALMILARETARLISSTLSARVA